MSNETEKTILDTANEIAGMPMEMNIKDGVFTISPSEGGIMLLATLREYESNIKEAWEAADELTETLEELRDENALFREMLMDVATLLEHSGMEREAKIINRTLWKVQGINADGEVVDFEWTEDEDIPGPLSWVSQDKQETE